MKLNSTPFLGRVGQRRFRRSALNSEEMYKSVAEIWRFACRCRLSIAVHYNFLL